jgi:hypothetical protein
MNEKGSFMTQSESVMFTKLADLLGSIESARVSLRLEPTQRAWYRGHANAAHGLLPSLFRPSVLKTFAISHGMGATLADPDARKDMLARLESDAYFDFVASTSRIDAAGLSSWDTLFLMRHFGLPTRTLDWTEVLGVALHFAVAYKADNATPGAIWLLNPYRLNTMGDKYGRGDTILPRNICLARGASRGVEYDELLAAWDHRDFPFEHPLGIYPDRRNERMHAQSGYFTIHGSVEDPIDLNPTVRDCVRKVIIPPDTLPAVRLFLWHAGIRERTLFPGLEGLSRDMRATYG